MAPPKRRPPKSKAQQQAEDDFQFEVISAREMNPQDALCFVVAGPPGDGKSTFLAQACEEGPSILLATLSRESTSWLYQKYNPDVILLEDREWKPEPPNDDGSPRGIYTANAYTRFIQVVEALASDEMCSADGEPYKVVLIDSGTELGENAWHEALSPFGVMDPAYMQDSGNRFGPYTALDSLMDKAVKALQALKTGPNPKHVGISWHVQSAKDDTTERVGGKDGYTAKKLSADHKAKDVEYEGGILPMVRGRFRRRLASLVDAFVWADILHTKTKDPKTGRTSSKPQYVLQVIGDEERHCKLPGPLPKEKYLDVTITNDKPDGWKKFKKLLAQREE
jgi:hypothetical protein